MSAYTALFIISTIRWWFVFGFTVRHENMCESEQHNASIKLLPL
jgi:hypothetical protein